MKNKVFRGTSPKYENIFPSHQFQEILNGKLDFSFSLPDLKLTDQTESKKTPRKCMSFRERIFAKGFPDNIGKKVLGTAMRSVSQNCFRGPSSHLPEHLDLAIEALPHPTDLTSSWMRVARWGTLGQSSGFSLSPGTRGKTVFRSHPHLQPSVEALLSFPLSPRLAPDTWLEGSGHHASTHHVRHSVHCDSGKMGIKCQIQLLGRWVKLKL